MSAIDSRSPANERIAALEEALVIFMAILMGEPADATEEEKLAAQRRLAELMEGIRGRVLEHD